tara:strand:- start:1702 stop:1938 length:237 start_codon:yes stop_codon:yes gene_type:complete
MLAQDIEIGQRVIVRLNNLSALIVGKPEYYSTRAKLVRIKYENSTRYEYMINSNLDLLPTEEQYPTHGGTHKRAEGEF